MMRAGAAGYRGSRQRTAQKQIPITAIFVGAIIVSDYTFNGPVTCLSTTADYLEDSEGGMADECLAWWVSCRDVRLRAWRGAESSGRTVRGERDFARGDHSVDRGKRPGDRAGCGGSGDDVSGAPGGVYRANRIAAEHTLRLRGGRTEGVVQDRANRSWAVSLRALWRRADASRSASPGDVSDFEERRARSGAAKRRPGGEWQRLGAVGHFLRY